MKQKMNSIQALRGLACMCVFLEHCYYNMAGWPLSVFIMMSAFLMVNSRIDKPDDFDPSVIHNIKLAWKKMKDLYPLYIITLIPILLLDIYNTYIGTGSSPQFILKELVLSLFLLQSWVPTCSMAFNGVAWYLSTTLFLYFAFPYIMAVIRKYKKKMTAFLVIAVLIVLEFVVSLNIPAIRLFAARFHPVLEEADYALWFTLIFPLFRLIDFAIGCNLGYIFHESRNRQPSKTVVWSIDILATVFFGITQYLYRPNNSFFGQECFRHAFIFIPFAMLVVYSFALNLGPSSKLLTNKATVFFGNISAQVYLIHQDVIRFLLIISSYFGMSMAVFRVAVIPVALSITIFLSLAYQKLLKRRKQKSTLVVGGGVK